MEQQGGAIRKKEELVAELKELELNRYNCCWTATDWKFSQENVQQQYQRLKHRLKVFGYILIVSGVALVVLLLLNGLQLNGWHKTDALIIPIMFFYMMSMHFYYRYSLRMIRLQCGKQIISRLRELDDERFKPPVV